MVRKKVDSRVRTLIENGVKLRHRSLFLIVGDKGRDQIVNLHYILSKCSVKQKPSVLWCYKKDLGFSSHRKKRMRQLKKMMQKGLLDPDNDDPFELFVSATDIRYCYYKETHKILGSTYGMLILQDFEALTPNILARTIETVEGGGIVVLLLNTMSSLKQLYSLTMDVHSRFRTEARANVVNRFNERFILSLGNCPTCLAVDDELNILPISSHARSIEPVRVIGEDGEQMEVKVTPQELELRELKESLSDSPPVGPLIGCARTLDQGKALLAFLEVVSEKSLRHTAVLTASRGRGKSAALGLSIAGAVAFGYANIFLTAPSPENLKTVFEFICKGFDAIGYEEHLDYELVQSTNPEFSKAIVRVNVFRDHRQTIQYIQPHDSAKLSHAELVVIDEAAAIPLPIVKKLLGPYLVFMSSTINGYEGTGRSLSLKLVSKLRQQSAGSAEKVSESAATSASGRALRELELGEPIRYAPGDPVESWLHSLLCLDATKSVPVVEAAPHPSKCSLYYVNRDTLFSYHRASEKFLQSMMSLYVASHYKNTPNDLQLLSDSPSALLFVLLGPVNSSTSAVPEVLAVIQVALEGSISRDSFLAALGRGQKAAGDLVSWTLGQQFQDSEFAGLSGARVVRIAVHPECQRMGYGSRALTLLREYFAGQMTDLREGESEDEGAHERTNDAGVDANEPLAPRKQLPPLLVPLDRRRPEPLDWLGVSFGLTQELFTFWQRAGYAPVYLRLTPNSITGEHTCIMLRGAGASQTWVPKYYADFRRRFVELLSFKFREFAPALALGFLLHGGFPGENDESVPDLAELRAAFTSFDLRRLESYAKNLVDYHVILDLVPVIARLLFHGRFGFKVSYVQAAIVMGLGLQHKSLETLEKNNELNLPATQALALFNKAVRKVVSVIRRAQEEEYGKELPKTETLPEMQPLDQSLDEELREGGVATSEALRKKQENLIRSLGLQEFAIKGSDAEWAESLRSKDGDRVSIKSKGSAKQAAADGTPKGPKKKRSRKK